jgi:hypothetical protein
MNLENKVIVLNTQEELNQLLIKNNTAATTFKEFPCIFYLGVGFNKGTYTINGITKENLIELKKDKTLGIMKVIEFTDL